jgi:hypothetical protein
LAIIEVGWATTFKGWLPHLDMYLPCFATEVANALMPML